MCVIKVKQTLVELESRYLFRIPRKIPITILLFQDSYVNYFLAKTLEIIVHFLYTYTTFNDSKVKVLYVGK